MKRDDNAMPEGSPATFAELQPPCYFSKTLGRFVTVRMLTDEEAEERYEQLWEWFGDSTGISIPKKFRPSRLRDRTPPRADAVG